MGLVLCILPSPGLEVRQVALSIRDWSGWRMEGHNSRDLIARLQLGLGTERHGGGWIWI